MMMMDAGYWILDTGDWMPGGASWRRTGSFPPRDLDGYTIEESLGLEAIAVAIRAGSIRAVAGEEHADVHFVRLGLEPAEVTLHAIPRARPFVFLVFPVIGIA